MMKMTMVERHPPPHFQAAAPARHPRKGPSIFQILPSQVSNRDVLERRATAVIGLQQETCRAVARR